MSRWACLCRAARVGFYDRFAKHFLKHNTTQHRKRYKHADDITTWFAVFYSFTRRLGNSGVGRTRADASSWCPRNELFFRKLPCTKLINNCALQKNLPIHSRRVFNWNFFYLSLSAQRLYGNSVQSPTFQWNSNCKSALITFRLSLCASRDERNLFKFRPGPDLLIIVV